MRSAQSYRSARREYARVHKFIWRELERQVVGAGPMFGGRHLVKQIESDGRPRLAAAKAPEKRRANRAMMKYDMTHVGHPQDRLWRP